MGRDRISVNWASGSSAVRLSVLLAGCVACLLLVAVFASPASADGTPDIGLTKSTDTEVLLGENSTVTLTASNSTGQPIGFNLSFRDVLPAGIAYVPGSSPDSVGEPQVISDAPGPGQTTLIWSDVADLTGNSSFSFSFEVSHDTSVYAVGDTYDNQAGAYVNCDFSYVPKFDAQGQPTQSGGNPDCSGAPPEESYTGSANASASTTIEAIRIEKSEPSPEGELLRGVHDNQTVYTLRVTNNAEDPTVGIEVEDFLPAGLEFLGCATEDNTTDTPTNPGSAEEYPGSGPINPGNAPGGLTDCVTPSTVETVSDPPGLPAGVYTHVVWTGLGPLAASGTFDITYAAAIPLRSNTMTWSGAEPPMTGPQGSNLDNNSGPEIADEQGLTNHAAASGSYLGGGGPVAVRDDADLTRSAEDLRLRKTVSPTTLGVGQISTWTLLIESGEYLYFTGVEVSDTLGDGYCPLGSANFEVTPPPASAECDPVPGADPSVPYSSVVEQADGSWEIGWDSSVDPGMLVLGPDSNLTLTFPTRTREFFQQNFQNATPVLANDTLRNDVEVSGTGHAICAPGAPVPCPPGDPDRIDSDFVDGDPVGDQSSATQSGEGPTIDKQVSPTVNGDCGSLGDYGSGNVPVARPGDTVCWRLTMDFPDELETGKVRVADVVPAGTTYVPGSTEALAGNTATIATAAPPEPDLVGGALFWPLDDGGDVVLPGKVFDVVFAVRAERTPNSSDGDITGNLMKAAYENSAGTSFPLRDQEDFEISQPEIDLLKGVMDVNDQPPGGNGPNVDGAVVTGGDTVTYRIDITNDGSLDADNTQVWDLLPEGITCADVDSGSISSGGTCNAAEDRIEWSGLTVAANDSLTLTYDVLIPDGFAGGDVLVNQAGVRQFESESGTGPYVQIPQDNIDPTQDPDANAPEARDPSNVVIEASVLVKTRSTEVGQPGNDPADQATIGERIDYTVTATIPEGTSLYGAETALVDNVSSRMTVVPGSSGATLDNGGGPVPLPTAGLTLSETGNAIRIDFPDPYANPENSGADVIVLTFRAIVNDLYPDNFAQGTSTQYTLPNTATLSWQNPVGEARSASGSVSTTVVEPQISLQKTADTAGPISPGDNIEYTVQVSNGSGARVSTANDTVIVDTVPAGLVPVNGGVPVVDGGTVNPDGGIWNEAQRTITWPVVSTIAPGASVSRTFNVTVEDDAVGSAVLVNQAEATTTSMPGSPAGERTSSTGAPGYLAQDSLPLTIAAPAIAKVGSPRSATIGEHVTHTIYAALGAQLTEYDAAIVDDLPDGLVFDEYLTASCIIGCPVPVTIQPLNVVPNGNGQTIGWWLGDVPAAPDIRVLRLTYSAHIGEQYNGGGDVLAGDSLVNSSSLLYNVTDQITTPPTDPPDPADFDEVLTDDHTTNVIEPEIVLDKSVSGDIDGDDQRNTQPGDDYTYSIAVTNQGDSPAYDVEVTDEPDVELTDVEVATGPLWQITKNWSASDREINWTIPGPIDPGEMVTLTYTADLVPSAQLSNLQQVINTADVPAYWGVPEAEREDPDNAGVEYREYTEVEPDTVTLTVLVPQLQLVKTTGQAGFPDTGDAQTETAFPWRIVVTNPNAGSELRDVDLTDVLPPNWTYQAGSAQFTGSGTLTPGGQVDPTVTTAATGDTLAWSDIADLDGGQNVIVDFSAVPQPQAAVNPGLTDPHVNDAEASGVDTSGAGASADSAYEDEDDATATLLAPAADLGITKVADDPTPIAGTDTTWTLVVTNNGPQIAPSVEVDDLLPAGLSYVEAVPEQGTCVENPTGTMHCELGQIGVGEQVEIALTTAVAPDTAGQVLVNPADVSDPNIDDQNPANDHDEDQVTPDASADVSIEKTVGTSLFAGQIGTYELKVRNDGPSTAEDVTIEDTLPEGLTYAGAVTPAGTCSGSGRDFSCELGDLAPEQEVTVIVSVNVLEGGEYTNCAETGSETPDPATGNNRSCDTSPAANTDLAITKTGPPYFPVGQNRDYTLLVTNVGDQPSGGTVTVTDQILDSLEPLAAFGDGWDCGIEGQLVTCTRTDPLAPGASFPLITVTVTARENLLFRPIPNTGHVSMPGDPNPANDTDSVITEKGAICDRGSLTLTPKFVWVGEKTFVRVTVRSRDGAPAVGIPVKVRGNGKGGASAKTRTLTTNMKGRAGFTVRAANTDAAWTASVPQCGLSRKLRPRRQQSCQNMTVNPPSIVDGRATTMTTRLRAPSGKGLRGVTVIFKGDGVRRSGRTDKHGVARFKIQPSSSGKITVSAPKATRCKVQVGVQAGTGSQLTG